MNNSVQWYVSILIIVLVLNACASVQAESVTPETALSATGFIEAQEITIAPEVGGRVTALPIDVGEEVTATMPVVFLDARIAKAEVLIAEAKLQEAEAQLRMAHNGVTPADLRAAEAQLTQAQAARQGACQAWEDALAILENPQELERQIAVAQAQARAAEAAVQTATAYKDVAAIGAGLFEEGREALSNLPDKVTIFSGGMNDLPVDLPSEIEDFIDEHGVDGTYTYEDMEIIVKDGHITANKYLNFGLPLEAQFAPNSYWRAWVGVNTAQAGYQGAQQALGLLYKIRDTPYQIQAQVDDARAQCHQAQAQEVMAQAQVDALNQGATDEEIAALDALVQQAQAELAQKQVALTQQTLYAPTDGLVLERLLDVGELAAPSIPILTLANLNTLQLQVYVPSADLSQIHLGQSVEVCSDAAASEGSAQPCPHCAVIGTVSYIGQEAEFPPQNVPKEDERAALTFAVRVRIVNDQRCLKPGMSAEARFVVESRLTQ